MRKYLLLFSYQGITLVELLTTLTVLSIIAVIAAPSLSDLFERRRIIGAAEAIYDQLIMARSEAIKQTRDTYVRIQPGISWCHGVSDLPNPNATRCNCTQTDPTQNNACTLLVHGAQNRVLKILSSAEFRNVSIAAPTAQTDIQFNFARGTATNNTIRLSTPKGYELRIIVSRLGRVRICVPSGNMGGYPTC